MANMASLSNYPPPSQDSLREQFVGKTLNEVPTPSVVLDRSKLIPNCNAMLNVCEKLGVGFRAHIKSHKTIELSRLQVGEKGPANFIVSTVIEAERLLPLVQEYQANGRESSILYGVPIPQSSIPRIHALAVQLLPGSINLIIDNHSAFSKFRSTLAALSPAVKIGIFIKLDTGYRRAGILTSAPDFPNLVQDVASSSASGPFLKGFYSHYGHSYAGNSPDDAAFGLIAELEGLESALAGVPASFTGKLILSAGATPTATAAQNMLESSASPRVAEFLALLKRLQEKHEVELHAGVYPLLDCQQVATGARPGGNVTQEKEAFAPLSADSIAISMVLEVTSTYPARSPPEALVSAGSLAMGREPCKAYSGWGIVAPRLDNASTQSTFDMDGSGTGWIVGRISQEHGILVWQGDESKMRMFEVGERVQVWPNHACVAGAGAGWYLVVDGDDKVVDVWVRWRGW